MQVASVPTRGQRRVAAVVLNLRSESGASHQQHGKETAGENVKRKAEARPPHRDTGILNEQVMKEVENSVAGEGSHNQMQVPSTSGNTFRVGLCYSRSPRRWRAAYAATLSRFPHRRMLHQRRVPFLLVS